MTRRAAARRQTRRSALSMVFMGFSLGKTRPGKPPARRGLARLALPVSMVLALARDEGIDDRRVALERLLRPDLQGGGEKPVVDRRLQRDNRSLLDGLPGLQPLVGLGHGVGNGGEDRRVARVELGRIDASRRGAGELAGCRRLQEDERADERLALSCGNGCLDQRVGLQGHLNRLLRVELAGVQLLLPAGPTAVPEEAVGVQVDDVAGVEPAIGVEHLGVLLRASPVASENEVAAHPEHTGVRLGVLLSLLEPDLRAGTWLAQ